LVSIESERWNAILQGGDIALHALAEQGARLVVREGSCAPCGNRGSGGLPRVHRFRHFLRPSNHSALLRARGSLFPISGNCGSDHLGSISPSIGLVEEVAFCDCTDPVHEVV